MRTAWLRTIEQIALACFRDQRVIGVTAPHSLAGVSTLAHAFAELSASWGVKTLLTDLSTAASHTEISRRWAPGIGDPKNFLEHRKNGYDVIQIDTGTSTTIGYGNPRHFLAELFEELDEYKAIVVDLPAILEFSAYTMSPIIGALSCDTVIMVCSKGLTTFDQLKKGIEVLQVAGVRIGGTVLNEFGQCALKAGSKYGGRELTTDKIVANLVEKATT